MNISFYTAAVGAQQQQLRLDVHGNNIANINTYGYQARRPSFSALMTGPVTGIEEDLPRGVGSRLEGTEAVIGNTAIADTGVSLDYAIAGDGFFAVIDPTTGAFSYTRDGSFTRSQFQVPRTDENGETVLDEFGEQVFDTKWYLSDGMGRFVLSRTGGPIEVDDTDVELPVGIFDFINYNGIQSAGENTFAPIGKNGQVQLGSGTLIQGALEMSNSDLAYEMSKVIESQRSFSLMLRMVTTSDEIETTVNNLR